MFSKKLPCPHRRFPVCLVHVHDLLPVAPASGESRNQPSKDRIVPDHRFGLVPCVSSGCHARRNDGETTFGIPGVPPFALACRTGGTVRFRHPVPAGDKKTDRRPTGEPRGHLPCLGNLPRQGTGRDNRRGTADRRPSARVARMLCNRVPHPMAGDRRQASP
jgi:hypothetical protein